MAGDTKTSMEDILRKYELAILGTSAILLMAVIQKIVPTGHNVPVASLLAIAIFLYLTRYIIEPRERSKALFIGLAAGIGLTMATTAQILFLRDIGISNPIAGIVNLGLMGIFVSTVLYLYVIGAGLDVIGNYSKRFNKKYHDFNRPLILHSLLLLTYMISAGKYLLVLYMLRITK